MVRSWEWGGGDEETERGAPLLRLALAEGGCCSQASDESGLSLEDLLRPPAVS